MGLISRVYTFVNGTAANATEVNAEFDTIHTMVNGNIDNANISASAAIAATKVDPIPPGRVLDHADTEAEYKTMVTPGDTGNASSNLPSTLEGELERLRYRIGANKGYLTNAFYMDNSGPTITTLSWTEPGIVGPNLLPNPGFEVQSGAADSAPDGWTLVGTPDEVDIEVPAFPTYGLEKRSLRILTDAANEGIETEIGGLKSGAKYLIGMAYTITDNGNPTPGVISLSTTDGLTTGDYQNLAITTSTEAASTVVVVQGIVKAQTPAVTMTVSITATEAGADFNLIEAWMYEVSDGIPAQLPHIPMQTATYSTANDTLTNSGAGAWSNRADLTLEQYIPFRGYRLTYEVTLCYKGTTIGGTGLSYEYAFRLQQTIDGGVATTVEGPYSVRNQFETANEFGGGTVHMKYVIENPTPGSTYSFSTDVYTDGSAAGEADTIIFNPSVGSASLATQSQARLVVERI